MPRPRFAYGGQPRTDNKGWSYSLGLGVGLTAPHLKKYKLVTKCLRDTNEAEKSLHSLLVGKAERKNQ
jgi:hypothetical protein